MMHFLKRTMAFVLTFVICAETLLGGGVASAVALTPNDEEFPQQAEQLFAEEDVAPAVDVDTGIDVVPTVDIDTYTNSGNGSEDVVQVNSSVTSSSDADANSVDSTQAASSAADSSTQPDPVVAAVGDTSANSNVNASSTLDATIDVFWASVDDKGDDIFNADDNRVWTQDSSQYKSYAATTKVRVLRNGIDAAEFELTGEVDTAAHEAEIGGDAFTWQEVAPWRVLVSGLTKYDVNSSEYNYLFLEEPASGFVSKNVERGIDVESSNLCTRFYNARGDAENSGTVVPISVQWADGGDAASRMPVKVGLYASDTISVDGQTAYDKDMLIATVDLNEGDFWYNEINVPVSGLDIASSFYIAEVSTYDGNSDTRGRSKVVSRDEALRNEYAGSSGYAALLRNWPESDSAPRMLSADSNQGFAYRVTYQRNTTLGSFEVKNQRIGFTEAAISRTWLDEGADESARPKSAFTLVSSGSGIKFVYDAGGVLYARASGKDYALYKKDTSGSLTPLRVFSDVTVSNEQDSITVNEDVLGASSMFSIVNLPKYDAQGLPVNWTVEQNWTSEHGDYQISGGDAEQTRVSPWHQEDQLTFSFANKRAGVKSVTYHAKWFDHYIKDELNQRPDAGLELYRLVNEYDADGNVVDVSSLEVVPANEYDARRVWIASNPADCAANDFAGNFTQYITLANLPKYDAQGRAYIYYACVNLDESQGGQETLSYYYDESVSQDNYTVDPGSWSSADAEVGAAVDRAAVSDSVMAYREDSTFNYRICGEAALAGKLYWVDKNNAFSTRPTSVSLKLVRTHQDGSPDGALVGGEVNLQTTDPSAPNYLVWTAQPFNDGSTWAYEIRNLEKWDFDGRPWTYTVSENPVDSRYEIKPGTDNGGSCSSVVSEFPDIANALKDLATLAKTDVSGEINWNDYGSGLANDLDPATCSIKLKLFRSVAGGSEELVVDGSAGVLPDSVLSWSKNGNNSWMYSFKDLPEYDQNAQEYTYRVEEAGSEIPGWHFAGYGNDGTIIYVADNAGNPDNPDNPDIPGGGAGDSDNPGSSSNASGNTDNSDKLETVLPVGTSDKSAGSESAVAKQATTPKTGDSLPVCMFIIFSLAAFVLSSSYLIARCLRKLDW